jgi:PmbA protein
VPALEALARALASRLSRTGRRVEAWAERSAGSVRVANHRGVFAGYEVTLAGIGAVVETLGAGGAPPCRVHFSGAGLPTLQDVERLVDEADRRLDPPVLAPTRRLPARMPVCFAPRAAATLLRPIRAALTGREAWLGGSPLRGRIGERVFDERFSLSDDPLAPDRPGSRPLDDEGVVSRRIGLVERGRLMQFLADLETGARAGVPSTGHGWRTAGYGGGLAPRVGSTNLRVTPGIEGRATLRTMMGQGLLVEDLEWAGGPNPGSGDFALPAPWTYLVETGSIRGRLENVVLTGNAFTLLQRLGAVGSDAEWIGGLCTPTLLIDGVAVGGDR